jgi:hypothetical protein
LPVSGFVASTQVEVRGHAVEVPLDTTLVHVDGEVALDERPLVCDLRCIAAGVLCRGLRARLANSEAVHAGVGACGNTASAGPTNIVGRGGNEQ